MSLNNIVHYDRHYIADITRIIVSMGCASGMYKSLLLIED